jgi:hypothetical protein
VAWVRLASLPAARTMAGAAFDAVLIQAVPVHA